MFIRHLYERYGISFPPWLAVEEGREKIWAYPIEVLRFPGRGVRRGLIVGRKNKFGYKPTTDFVILFGWMATRNYVNIKDRGRLIRFIKGEPLQGDFGEEGLKIVLWEGRGVCMGLYLGGQLRPLFPKHRQQYVVMGYGP